MPRLYQIRYQWRKLVGEELDQVPRELVDRSTTGWADDGAVLRPHLRPVGRTEHLPLELGYWK
jgi:hypothetical protein